MTRIQEITFTVKSVIMFLIISKIRVFSTFFKIYHKTTQIFKGKIKKNKKTQTFKIPHSCGTRLGHGRSITTPVQS